MSIHRRRKTKENMNGMPASQDEVSLDKILHSADYVPLPYRHSEKFYNDGLNPLEAEKQRLLKMPADWLLKDMRIPSIKADSLQEIELGKKQYVNHLYSISSIMDLTRGDICLARENLKRIDEEISDYDSEIKKLKNLMDE